ncbi:MarR family winged helix-turn-helix transcriptional regulator [Parvibaculum sp. MBR-TMA-1.3b-4.2]|jgi:DNA-binding MarR family transcriptional regulator
MAETKRDRVKTAVPDDTADEMSSTYFAQLLTAVGEELATRYDDATGLNRNQNRILIALVEEDGLTQTELANLLAMHKVSVGLHIAELEAMNLVTREAHPTDGRAKCIRVTPFLRMQAPRARGAFDDIHRIATEGIAPEDYTIMLNCLARMHANLAKGDDENESPATIIDKSALATTSPANRKHRSA